MSVKNAYNIVIKSDTYGPWDTLKNMIINVHKLLWNALQVTFNEKCLWEYCVTLTQWLSELCSVHQSPWYPHGGIYVSFYPIPEKRGSVGSPWGDNGFPSCVGLALTPFYRAKLPYFTQACLEYSEYVPFYS